MKQLVQCLGHLLLVLGVFGVTGCEKTEHTQPPPQKELTLPIITVVGGAPVDYVGLGSVISDRRVDVASRLSGYIQEVSVQEGDAVKKGQLLARVEAADVDSNIRQAQAGAMAADAAYHDAKIDLDRYQTLFERGTVSDSDIRKARLRQDATKATADQARAGLEAAKAQSNYADIHSPVNGTVVARLRQAGDLAVPGGPILTLESGNDLLFYTFVTEQQVRFIKVDEPVNVFIDGLDAPLKGSVSRLVASADPVTRSYPVKIRLPTQPGLMPGMFGRAEFTIGKSLEPVVPVSALIERGGLKGVFVVDGSGIAFFRWLRLGREWPDRVEVMAGLDVGEHIVAVADPDLEEGDRVAAATGRPRP